MDVVMSDSELSELIESAVVRGYRKAREEMEASEWLNGRPAILQFLGVSDRTFRNNLRKGVYGTAVIGKCSGMKARRSDLTDAMKRYALSAL